MEQRPITENRSHSTNSPLWFLAGLWLGSTGAAQGFLVFIGIVAMVAIFIIGTIFSALATLLLTHWRMLVILAGASGALAVLGAIYMQEERKKVA
jgi:hypothetical protein